MLELGARRGRRRPRAARCRRPGRARARRGGRPGRGRNRRPARRVSPGRLLGDVQHERRGRAPGPSSTSSTAAPAPASRSRLLPPARAAGRARLVAGARPPSRRTIASPSRRWRSLQRAQLTAGWPARPARATRHYPTAPPAAHPRARPRSRLNADDAPIGGCEVLARAGASSSADPVDIAHASRWQP